MSTDQLELERHSFIIKIWFEEVGAAASQKKWRGHITHVGTGERRYVEGLRDISSFVQGHLAALGAEPNPPEESRDD